MKAIALLIAMVVGYPVTQPEYAAVKHGQSMHHIEQQFDNTGTVVRRWNSPGGVHHRVKYYLGTDGNYPQPQQVYVFIWYRKIDGWREYKKQCEPQFPETSIWHCRVPR